jgi:subtilisin family serine protease
VVTRRRRSAPAAAAVAGLLLGSVALVGAPAAGAAPSAASAAPSAASVRAQEWWLDDLHLPAAWSTSKGRGVVVGLVDTGVDATHPDLKGALVPGKDFSGHGAANGEAPAGAGLVHGTTMAGYNVGHGHGPGNAQGMLGAAPQARVMSLSLDLEPNSPAPQAIKYAADHGAKVINLSLDNVESDAMRDALKYAQQHDVVVVVASGNEGLDNGMNSFATYPGVVAVSGYVDDGHFTIATDSNFTGPQTDEPTSDKASDYLGGIAVSAPFETHDGRRDMVGTTTVEEGTYTEEGGTSNSTAIVSGVVALIRSAHPSWSAAQVIDVLIHTAYREPGHGYSPKHGFGIPDAAKAVAASTPSTCENPLGSLVTNSAGIWPTIFKTKDALTYTPRCESSSSSPPSTSAPPSSSTQSTGDSTPASSSPSSASAGPGGSSGGVPPWVWIVVAVVVVGGAAGLLLARRGRGGPPLPSPAGPGGPNAPGGWSGGGWPQQPPPPPTGWQPPPPGWTPPAGPPPGPPNDPGR